MKIEIWSDVVCPFCYIGKRNLELSLAQFSQRNQLEITWKSFVLDPHLPETARQSAVTAVPGTASLKFNEKGLSEGTSRCKPGAVHRITSVKRLIVCRASLCRNAALPDMDRRHKNRRMLRQHGE